MNRSDTLWSRLLPSQPGQRGQGCQVRQLQPRGWAGGYPNPRDPPPDEPPDRPPPENPPNPPPSRLPPPLAIAPKTAPATLSKPIRLSLDPWRPLPVRSLTSCKSGMSTFGMSNPPPPDPSRSQELPPIPPPKVPPPQVVPPRRCLRPLRGPISKMSPPKLPPGIPSNQSGVGALTRANLPTQDSCSPNATA